LFLYYSHFTYRGGSKESNSGPNLGRLLGVDWRAEKEIMRETGRNNATELIIK
jgi:hypothetical protein